MLQFVFGMWQVRVPAHFDVTAYVWCQINDKSTEQCQATVILPLSPARTGMLFNVFCFVFQFGVKDSEFHFWFVYNINMDKLVYCNIVYDIYMFSAGTIRVAFSCSQRHALSSHMWAFLGVERTVKTPGTCRLTTLRTFRAGRRGASPQCCFFCFLKDWQIASYCSMLATV